MTAELDYEDPDVCLSLFIDDPNGGDGKPRSNDEDGEPCSSCGLELLYDRGERMVYCLNDWYHG